MQCECKTFTCGPGKNKIRADICFMVLLRRLAYPCRFFDMVEDFGMPSNRLCEIFHTVLEIFFDRPLAVGRAQRLPVAGRGPRAAWLPASALCPPLPPALCAAQTASNTVSR